MDDNCSANAYNLLGTVGKIDSLFRYRGVSASGFFLRYAKKTGFKDNSWKYTHSIDQVTTPLWYGLSIRSRTALTTQYMVVLRLIMPFVVHPRADVYTLKFLSALQKNFQEADKKNSASVCFVNKVTTKRRIS